MCSDQPDLAIEKSLLQVAVVFFHSRLHTPTPIFVVNFLVEDLHKTTTIYIIMGCGFKYFLFSPLPGEMIQID